jgi:hypothetical protein
MKSEEARRPRGRPFVRGYDPRRQPRRPRPRTVYLFDELDKALARGDLRKMGKLLAQAHDQKQRIALLPEDTSPEEVELALNNLRRLTPELFEPRESDLLRLYNRDPEKALAVIPAELARRRLGLLETDADKGWPPLELSAPKP